MGRGNRNYPGDTKFVRDNVDYLQEEQAGENHYTSEEAQVFSSSPVACAAMKNGPLSDIAAGAEGQGVVEPFLHARQPVYEKSEDAVLGRQLVMTPWMLLDRLRDCQERTDALRAEACARNWGAERRRGRTVNSLTQRLDQLSDDLEHTLYILRRGGLWLDAVHDGTVETRADADGTPHQVARSPFTDGKPHGRPLPPDAPAWLRDLLGAA